MAIAGRDRSRAAEAAPEPASGAAGSFSVAEAAAAKPRDRDAQSRRPLLIAAVAFVVAALVTLIFAILIEQAPDLSRRSLPSNLGFFLLININITVLVLLFLLVAKNIFTLVLDRRRNILGARLRTKLVTAFVALSLVPTVLLFFVAKGILESVLQGWFSPQIAESIDGARGVAIHFYDLSERRLERQSEYLAETLVRMLEEKRNTRPSREYAAGASSGPSLAMELEPKLHELFSDKRRELGLESIALYAGTRESSRNVIHEEGSLPLPPHDSEALEKAFDGKRSIHPERVPNEEFLRSYIPLSLDGDTGNERLVLVSTERVAPELVHILNSVIDAYDDYAELRAYRRPLASTYLLTLVVVTLLIVFAAMWVGFYLSRGLAIPIGLLAKATDQVAHGNLDYHIPELGDDELGVLVRSFNTMTRDLKETTGELVARRRYMETVLESVAVGVLTLDRTLRITTCNLSAAEILGIGMGDSTIGRQLEDVLSDAFGEALMSLLRKLDSGGDRTMSEDIAVVIEGRIKHLHVGLTKLFGDQGEVLGVVALLDDMTELVGAQRMAAWREVARRIAHEIKNPLTPIQLCAQRMLRRFQQPDDGSTSERKPFADENVQQLVVESTEIIIQQVENMRTLVNEFSRFARMPRSNPLPSDLNKLVADAMPIFREAHPEIRFVTDLDPRVPILALDQEQIGRALINLITNGIASIRERAERALRKKGEGAHADDAEVASDQIIGQIEIDTHYDPEIELVKIRVSDDGVGVPDSDKEKLFEPYFSTKTGGTGLGLAIVSTIVADHQGFIRVRDNEKGGATFVIELPISRGPSVLS